MSYARAMDHVTVGLLPGLSMVADGLPIIHVGHPLVAAGEWLPSSSRAQQL